DERHEKDETDDPAEQPVQIFPPEDALEFRERYRGVDLPVFRRELVFGEGLLPLRVRQRRDRTDDRLPLGDRQSRMRQPRDTTDDDHCEHERATDEQPCSDAAVSRRSRVRSEVREWNGRGNWIWRSHRRILT